jgi:hypothetical protein
MEKIALPSWRLFQCLCELARKGRAIVNQYVSAGKPTLARKWLGDNEPVAG